MNHKRNHIDHLFFVLTILIAVTSGEGDDAVQVRSAASISSALSESRTVARQRDLDMDSIAAAVRPPNSSAAQINIHAIQFSLNSAEIEGKESYAQLRELAKALETPELRKATIVVEGHTCDLGDDAHNMALSRERATEVVRILQEMYGIPEGRLIPEGKGESAPIVRGTTETSRSKNRRVPFKRRN